MKMKQLIIAILLITITQTSITQDFWFQLDIPDTVTPRVLAQNSNNELFLASNHGVFTSPDDGLTWEHSGNLDESLVDIAITDDDVIYTGFKNLYLSDDNGQSWSLTSSGINMITMLITVDNVIYRGETEFIYRSYDGGYLWELVYQTDNSHKFTDLIERDSEIYAGSIDFGGELSGLYKSDYNGSNWSLYALEETALEDLTVDNSNRILTASNGSILYSPGVFRSDSFGMNFENIYSENEVNAVSVDQLGGIYIGLESDLSIDWGVKYSSDDGYTWEDLSSGLIECSYFNQIFVSSNNYIYAITQIPFKLYRSINPIVSIEESEITKVLDFEVYPNPGTNQIRLRIASQYKHSTFEMFDINGKLIISKRISGKCGEINTGHLSSGIYIYRLYSMEGLSESGKWIKQ